MTALMITFIVSGIWHGAAFTFIFWGIFNGVFLCIEAVTQKQRAKVEDKYNLKHRWWYILVSCVVVYLIFAFSQIFGRCENLGEAFSVIGKIFTNKGALFNKVTSYGWFSLFILFVKDFLDEFFPNKLRLFGSKHFVVRLASYIMITALILVIGVLDGGQFIYFQF